MSFYRRSDLSCSAPVANVGSSRQAVQRYGGRTASTHAPRLAFFTPYQRQMAYGASIADQVLEAAREQAAAQGTPIGPTDPSSAGATPPPAGSSSGISLTKILGGGAALAAALWWWKR